MKTSLHQIPSTLMSPPGAVPKSHQTRTVTVSLLCKMFLLGFFFFFLGFPPSELHVGCLCGSIHVGTPCTLHRHQPEGGISGVYCPLTWTCYQMGAQQPPRGRHLLAKCVYTARALLPPAPTSASLHFHIPHKLNLYCIWAFPLWFILINIICFRNSDVYLSAWLEQSLWQQCNNVVAKSSTYISKSPRTCETTTRTCGKRNKSCLITDDPLKTWRWGIRPGYFAHWCTV